MMHVCNGFVNIFINIIWLLLLCIDVNCFNNSDETTIDSFTNKETWGKEEYPNPRTRHGSFLCGNGETRRWICDPGKSLTESEVEAIDNTIVGWQMEARCPCENCLTNHGPYYQIMVAVVPKLKTYSNEVQDKLSAVREFAVYLRTGPWNHSRCDDSLLLALSIGDQAIWTAAGKTARDKLSEDCMDVIFSENVELLQSGVHGIALQNIVTEYISVLMGERSCGKRWPKWWKYLAIAVVSFGMLLFFADRFSRFVFQRPLFYCFEKNDSSVHRFQSQVGPEDLGYDTSESSLSRIGSNHVHEYIVNDFHNSDYSLHHSSTDRSSHETLRNDVHPMMISHKSDSSNSHLNSSILIFNPSNNYSDSNFADHSSANTLDMLDSNSSVRFKYRPSRNLHRDVT